MCLVLFAASFVFSEGSRQVMPTASSSGQLCINKSRNDFAFYDASPEFRLNISISNPSEKIRFGFGRVLETYTTDLVYRIKNPSGTVVYGPLPVPASGPGFIQSYDELLTGPFAGGYNYLELQPLTSGDYYLEFYYPPVSGGYSDNNRHLLEFFDITVVNAAGTNALNGRVWSKAWQFWSGDPGNTSNRFYGKMMILSDDSIVTQVDCNGFRGGTFSFSSNSTGCATTGNIEYDRKSAAGFKTYPQYKVFLNDPDNILFPTQKVTSGIIQPINVYTHCTNGGAEFGVKVLKDGTIRILIEINPSPGIDPEDVQIIADAKANPGGTGENLITWNGRDNYGRPVKNGTNLSFSVTNLSGMTHLPIHDIENNDFGYIVTQVRPAGGQLRIYWDDSAIGGTNNTSTGCITASGCHNWNNGFGDNRTINSWWYVSWTEIIGTPFISKTSPALPVVSGNSVHCKGPGSLDFSVAGDPNTLSYFWSYSGTGAVLSSSGTTATLNFTPDATQGTLSVYGINSDCGEGPTSSMQIHIEPLPVVSVTPFTEMCYTAPGFKLTGGNPDGGIYYVDGIKSDSLFPFRENEGLHSIVYSYTSPMGCSNSDTSFIVLRSGDDCQGKVYFPSAFTPDGNSINDTFRPVAEMISSFKMYIFDRWGQLVFTTDNVSKGWDGKLNGEPCPAGTYSYLATFGPSLRSDDIETKRGVFALVR